MPETLTLLKASQVTVYAIGLVENAGSSRLDFQMKLQQLAEATGGQAFFPTRLKEVDGTYEKVLAEIQGQYHLGYLSSNAATDGAVAQGRGEGQAARRESPDPEGLLRPLQSPAEVVVR